MPYPNPDPTISQRQIAKAFPIMRRVVPSLHDDLQVILGRLAGENRLPLIVAECSGHSKHFAERRKSLVGQRQVLEA